MSSASKDQLAAERYSSAPAPAGGRSQTREIVTQPTVAWVASVIRQDSTRTVEETRTAINPVGVSSPPLAATTGRKMHISVLVPNKKASSTRGASVSSASHSG